MGHSQGRHRRRQCRHRVGGARAGRRDPDRGAGDAHPDARRQGDGRGPRERRGDRGARRPVQPRCQPDVPEAHRAGHARAGVRTRRAPLSLPRIVGESEPGA